MTGPAAPPKERPVGVIVNPLSGRDVRRLVARASAETPVSKRNQVQRAIVGAAAAGARRLLLVRDLFRISDGAAEALRLGELEVRFLEGIEIRTAPADTRRIAVAMREAGCGAVVVLGGDGTNREVARAWPEAPVVPISTGTNNVFPTPVEATMAGAAAGLVATGRAPLDAVARRAKVLRLRGGAGPDALALIDAVLLEGEHPGSLLPFDPARIRHVLLSRAEPASVGMSPLGGLLHPCGAEDDFGVEVRCSAHGDGGRPLLVPISPGLYRTAHVRNARRVALGEAVVMRGPGLLEFDGDRERVLGPGEEVAVRVERDGPWVIDVPRTLAYAARHGLYLDRPHWHDEGDATGGLDCC